MADSIQTVRVVDSRLMSSPDLKFAVHEGAQSVAYQQFQANSVGSSQVVFNIQVPSQSTVVDKRVVLRSEVNLVVPVYNNIAAGISTTAFLGLGGAVPVNGAQGGSGAETALAPFPLQSCFSNIQATINNYNVSVNIQDILELIVRLQNLRTLSAKINMTTPLYPDQYQNYNDAIGLVNDPLSSYGNTIENVATRGAYKVSVSPSTLQMGNTTVNLTFKVGEPVLASPFIWAYEYFNMSGMYGLTNINYVFNVQGANRCLRTTLTTVAQGNAYLTAPISFATNPFTLGETYLEFMFLSPKPSQVELLAPKNSHMYYELPRYLQTGAGSIAPNATLTFTSPVIQLNNVPDTLYLWCRKIQTSKTNSDADYCLPLASSNPLSIQFNNNIGILSTATPYELYRMTANNGMQCDWQQFSGEAEVKNSAGVATVPTAGCPIALSFANDINVPELYLAPGSIGNYNLQLTVNFKNNTGALLDGTKYELVICVMNSGVIINAAGSTAAYLSILTKDDVSNAITKSPYSRTDVQRLVGGSFWSTLKSVAGAVLPVVKAVGSVIPHPAAQLVSKGIGALGYGMAGAGMAGAGEAGAGKKRKDARLE